MMDEETKDKSQDESVESKSSDAPAPVAKTSAAKKGPVFTRPEKGAKSSRLVTE